MYGNILVTLKRDSNDEIVVEHGSGLDRLTGGRLTLLHVVHSHSRDEAVFLEEEARRYLETSTERLRGEGLQAEFRVVPGEPAEAIKIGRAHV
jgi:nucleotide-binding universal stress UspA family protein